MRVGRPLHDGAVPEIVDPSMSIEEVENHPGRRNVRVTYELVVRDPDPSAGQELLQRIVVHGVDEHDAAIPPRGEPVAVMEATIRAVSGTHQQMAEAIVNEVDLDVEEDLWRNTPSGDAEPIAEWLDHLVAEISLAEGQTVVATATTPVVTGSWGPLGSD